MTNIIIIRGPMGVGKSTVARALARKIGARYISYDQIMNKHHLDTPEEDGIPLENFINANEIVVKTTMQSSTPVIIDGNFYYQKQIDDLNGRIQLKHLWIYLQAPLEVCLRRNIRRAKSYSNEAVEFLYEIVSDVNYGEVIDTQSRTVKDTVQKIMELIK